jgi:hypothetical protein
MKRFHPSPALVVSLIALFVALGGTSYAAINSLPANSVGTRQLKNGAVTALKLAYGQTLPSGKTETGEWAYGNYSGTSDQGGSGGWAYASFLIPLASALDGGHTIFVSGISDAHCPGVDQAEPGYLCVYAGDLYNANTPNYYNIFNPESPAAPAGTGTHGWAMYLSASGPGLPWFAGGTYAVTAP